MAPDIDDRPHTEKTDVPRFAVRQSMRCPPMRVSKFILVVIAVVVSLARPAAATSVTSTKASHVTASNRTTRA